MFFTRKIVLSKLLERIIPFVYKYYYAHLDQYKAYGIHIVNVNSIAPLIGIAGNVSSVKHLSSFWISLNHVNSNLVSCVKRSSRIQCVSGTMSAGRWHPVQFCYWLNLNGNEHLKRDAMLATAWFILLWAAQHQWMHSGREERTMNTKKCFSDEISLGNLYLLLQQEIDNFKHRS